MESKAYEYMDWPRIEAVVYGEEASPKDVMAPRLTTDGVLIQGFFPEADKTEVLVGSRKYEMQILMHSPARSQKQRKKLSALVFIITRMRNWAHIPWRLMVLKEPALQYGHRTRCVSVL